MDTPKYQRATVQFEEQLKRALRGGGINGQRTNEAHFVIGGPESIAFVSPRTDIDNHTRFRADKNNVNIDQEMSDLAENSEKNIQFTELLTRKYGAITNVIQTAGRV